MVVMRRASEADFTFTAKEYDGELRVLQFNGTEAISEPFRYSFRLAAMDSEIDFDTIVGKIAYLTIFGEEGDRYVHGIVNKLTQAGTGSRYTVYNLELVPKIWLLSMIYHNRIFQEMNVKDIIDKVFKEAGITSDFYNLKLTGTYPSHEYCVQYHESDFNFISRLMEEEGIFYFFEHTEDSHVMIIADDTSVHTPIDPSTIVFKEVSGLVPAQEYVYEYNFSQQVRQGKVLFRDFNFEQPSLGGMDVLSASGEGTPDYEYNIEINDYPGLYTKDEIGVSLSSIRLGSIRTNRKLGSGKSTCRRFIPGYKFTLDQHPRSDFDQEYLITRVITLAVQPLGEDSNEEGLSYNNEFECIPSSVFFRPPQKSLRPVVEGIQTAIVVGPSDEEIYTDKYGRVKVRFHWDHGWQGQAEENSSCWIRVSHGWAGTNWGIIFIPRVGQEVIVDFLEGNPDRPLITGRVYNGDNMSPYPLPDDKTKSTIKSNSYKGGKGYNELRFEDTKGKEEVFVHAQKDMNEKIENNMSTSVGANQSISVGANRSITVGNNESYTIKGNESIDITKDRTKKVTGNEKIDVYGTYTETIKGNTAIKITEGTYDHDVVAGTAKYHVQGALTEKYDATQDTTVKGNIEIKSSTGSIHLTADTDITLKVGSSKLEMKKDGTINLEGVKIGIKGTTDVGVTGTGSVTIKGGDVTSQAEGTHSTKGAIVLSNGSATNTVKGGMVMLNP